MFEKKICYVEAGWWVSLQIYEPLGLVCGVEEMK